MKKFVFTVDTTMSYLYETLKTLEVGDIIEYHSDYATLERRIGEVLLDGNIFEIRPILAGTELFTHFGSNHAVVSKKHF